MTSVPVVATADSSSVTGPVQPLANKLRGVPTADTRGATPMENAKRSGGNAVNAGALVLIRKSGIPRIKSNLRMYVREFFIFHFLFASANRRELHLHHKSYSPDLAAGLKMLSYPFFNLTAPSHGLIVWVRGTF